MVATIKYHISFLTWRSVYTCFDSLRKTTRHAIGTVFSPCLAQPDGEWNAFRLIIYFFETIDSSSATALATFNTASEMVRLGLDFSPTQLQLDMEPDDP